MNSLGLRLNYSSADLSSSQANSGHPDPSPAPGILKPPVVDVSNEDKREGVLVDVFWLISAGQIISHPHTQKSFRVLERKPRPGFLAANQIDFMCVPAAIADSWL